MIALEVPPATVGAPHETPPLYLVTLVEPTVGSTFSLAGAAFRIVKLSPPRAGGDIYSHVWTLEEFEAVPGDPTG